MTYFLGCILLRGVSQFLPFSEEKQWYFEERIDIKKQMLRMIDNPWKYEIRSTVFKTVI